MDALDFYFSQEQYNDNNKYTNNVDRYVLLNGEYHLYTEAASGGRIPKSHEDYRFIGTATIDDIRIVPKGAVPVLFAMRLFECL